METLKCVDVHGGSCDFVAEGMTKEEALHQLRLHEEEMHGDAVDSLTPEQQAEREKLKRAHMDIPMNTRDEERQKVEDGQEE